MTVSVQPSNGVIAVGKKMDDEREDYYVKSHDVFKTRVQAGCHGCFAVGISP
jgi:hypothetical protein